MKTRDMRVTANCTTEVCGTRTAVWGHAQVDEGSGTDARATICG